MQRFIVRTAVVCLAVSSVVSPALAQKVVKPSAGKVPVTVGVPRGGVDVVAAEASATPARPVREALEGQPRIDGSTTAILLGQLLAARALGLEGQLRRMASPLRWEGAASSVNVVFPVDTPPAQLDKYQAWLRRQPQYSGTNGAYMSLVEDAADLILVAREPSADELKAAQGKGIEFDTRPVALDAFVFLVNTENPVSSLTLDQLRGIYTDTGRSDLPLEGRITNWQQVGGADQRIYAFTRNRNSGSEELMEKLMMQGRKIITGGDRMLMSMMGPIEGVSRNPNSIAYSVYYYEHVMSPQEKNKLLAINGIAPTVENIAARRYPLTAEVYVVTRKGIDRSTPAARVRDWLLTEEGQKLITAAGYVPITTKAATNAP